jgi:hypothetical protein
MWQTMDREHWLLHENSPCSKLHNQWRNRKGIKRIKEE